MSCGDLVIPQNVVNDGGGSDDGAEALDARVKPDCDAGHPRRPRLHRPLRRLADPHARARRPSRTSPARHVGRRRDVACAGFGCRRARRSTRPIRTTGSFPVGTKLWQELSILGKRIETRFSWKEAPTLWFRDDVRLDRRPLRGARAHASAGPTPAACRTRSPPSARARSATTAPTTSSSASRRWASRSPQAAGLDLAALVRQGLLTNPPATPPACPAT